MSYCLGIDIGGTKTAVALADEKLEIIDRKIFPTDSSLGAHNLVDRIAETYKELCQKVNIKPEEVSFAGVASPGPLDIKSGRIVHIATMGFKDVPIKDMLEKALSLPVFLENDANLAALAESVIGEGKGQNPVVYVTISTGIGCGIVVDGKILSGAFSSAGELGHVTVEKNGRECGCGKKGCLELYASGTAIAKEASLIRQKETDAKTVFALSREGDPQMREIIDLAADKLGLALSYVWQLLDPEVIVLGGSVTKDYKDFEVALRSALKEYTQNVSNRDFNIKISRLGGEQVLLGALIYAKTMAK